MGKMVNGKGKTKVSSEINDLCDALNTLLEKDMILMFIFTSSMVARTPIYQQSPDDVRESKRLVSID